MKGVLRQPIVLMALAFVMMAAPARLCAQRSGGTQAESPAVQLLLQRAQSQEASGHMDLAAQSWQQVLLAQPDNLQALAGLARWYRMQGKDDQAQTYIDRIRRINPTSPLLLQVQSVVSNQARIGDLKRAAQLAQNGNPQQAMKIYRQVFGNTPPDNWAQAYYDTEAAIPSMRAEAMNGLRALVRKNPGNSAYAIDLGRTLTYDPGTRPEGVRILEKYQGVPEADAALRQALAYSVQNPAYIGAVRAYLKSHQDEQLATELAKTEAQQARASSGLARTPAERAAFAALSANHLEEAKTRFQALYQANPSNPRALAGLGFLQMKENNFGGAIRYFSQAGQNGLHARVIEDSLATSRFWYTMQQASDALSNDQLKQSEQDYAAALEMRHNSPDALAGLAGVYMKAQEPGQAIPIYQRLLDVKSSQSLAWRGLFLAETQSGHSNEALATNARMPSSVRRSLESDPSYLQALANAYNAAGQDAQAQQVLALALNLPFPQNGQNMKAGMRMQYAGLLAQNQRYAQAAGIYRDVLNSDPNNISAWQGLVAMEHQSGNDPQAIAVVEQMPPPVYDQALESPDFLSMLAAIYQGQHQMNIAQTFIERATKIYADKGSPVPVSLEVQVAAIDLQRNHADQAYGIYRQVLMQHPDQMDAWSGLLSALHQTGHDADALAQLAQIPAEVRARLEQNTDFLQTEASVYAATGNQPAALGIIQRIQRHYLSQRMLMPASVEVQEAWLLFNLEDDRDLYRTLMHLGDRADLTNEQRRTVQTIWATWSVRRATDDIKAGNTRLALEILTSARQAFPDNQDVSKALAGGYLQAGQPKEALAIYESLNTDNDTADDYGSMVGAALAAQNMKLAEAWLREGLRRYPNSPPVLSAAARFEQARGDNARAADYWRASLRAMPQISPTTELAHKLDQPDRTKPGRPVQQTNLVNLLNPDANLTGQNRQYVPLPSYRNPETYSSTENQPNNQPYGPDPYYQGTAPVVLGNQQVAQTAAPQYGQSSAGLPPSSQVLAQSSQPARHHNRRHTKGKNSTVPRSRQRRRPQSAPSYSGERLGQYNPQASLPSSQQPLMYPPSANQNQQPQPNNNQSLPGYSQPAQNYNQNSNPQSYAPIRPSQNNPNQYSPQAMGGYGRGGDGNAAGNASVGLGGNSNDATLGGNNAQLHLSITSGPVIRPQDEQPNADLAPIPVQELTLDTSESLKEIENAQKRQEAMLRAQQTLTEAAHPQDGGLISTQYSYQQPQQYISGPQQQVSAAPQQSYYVRPASPLASSNEGSYEVAEASQQQTNQQAAPPYPNDQQQNGASDQQLMQENLPPLRGPYVHAPRNREVNPREAAEEQLASIEGGYSGWLGGTGFLSHRSGNLGYDALSRFEAPLEASTPVGMVGRLTLVVDPVFLDSGQATKIPVIGASGQSELLGSELTAPDTPPAQQNAAGVGGEVQLTTNTFGASVGYTPYGFLISNVIGQFRWKPGNGPFTFTFDRSAVIDSQLSYSGLRDPASVTNVYQGNIWGGVISNAFQAQFGRGDAASGYYISGGGQYITGNHVQTNSRIDGDTGAYWRVWSVPDTGDLTLGVNLFGMHYAHNLQYFTYGQGGYFSPQAYMLANVPFTWQGRYGLNWHYQVAGAFGVQAFEQDSSPYYPLDPLLETASSNLSYPSQTVVGSNYDLHAEAAYHLTDHWYLGGFTSLNNTRDYNNQTIGFFVRFLFRSQNPTELGPTGLFPWHGLRPHMVP